MTARGFLVGVAALLAAIAAILIALVWRPSIDPIGMTEARSFDAALINRGAELAAIGNCNACHTAPGGRTFAGGRALPTPFGTIFSTNITPDAATCLGSWSEKAFSRAMREGVSRDCPHLYPSFPYDN